MRQVIYEMHLIAMGEIHNIHLHEIIDLDSKDQLPWDSNENALMTLIGTLSHKNGEFGCFGFDLKLGNKGK